MQFATTTAMTFDGVDDGLALVQLRRSVSSVLQHRAAAVAHPSTMPRPPKERANAGCHAADRTSDNSVSRFASAVIFARCLLCGNDATIFRFELKPPSCG